ncbi:MAG TPA: 4Fe-4S dicluster domain-containing protein [Bacteroidetes bacterium]|nr:4Fe-4S dicluster domain-containing protein [Bacteroidota bacterium]
MSKQVVFALSLLITLGVFAWTTARIVAFFRLTKPAFPVKDWGKRFKRVLTEVFGQSKMFRRPAVGLMHALVFWGFLVILFGSIEMVIDGLADTERFLAVLGPVYDVLIAFGDVFALVVLVAVIAFLIRRVAMDIPRFGGEEMKHTSHLDAILALSLIGLLMITLLGMNTAYVTYTALAGFEQKGLFPVSSLISSFLGSDLSVTTVYRVHEVNWWAHILLIFLFANILPYSKHFHVFMSVPNVFLSRLDPLGKLPNMPHITREIRAMLHPDTEGDSSGEPAELERFGVKDVEDITWKNYLDSLACTECGRCTAVCPARLTGKKLSPRKIIMDVRARMKEKGPGLIRKGKDFDDARSLLRDYVTEEELWACTTCNACARECPVNINHPVLIVDMRRYLVMEEASGPAGLNAVFSNIENNGAPWQYSREDRMLWAEDLYINA